MPSHIMSNNRQTTDDALSDVGVAVVGSVDLKLIEKIKSQTGSPDIQHRRYRQTELRWNSDCDAVVEDFETVSECSRYSTSS